MKRNAWSQEERKKYITQIQGGKGWGPSIRYEFLGRIYNTLGKQKGVWGGESSYQH